MTGKKIAMIFPYAPSYREAIYQLLDKEMDIDWFFAGNCDPHLKLLDYSKLNQVDLSLEEKRKGPFSTLKGLEFINLEKYDAIIIPGVFRCLSDLLMMLRHRKNIKPHLYLWTHGWYGKETWLERAIKKFFYPRVDGIFLYGNRAKQLMVKEGFEPSKLHVIHNSLDYEKQMSLRQSISQSDVFLSHFRNDNKVIIFIGRLTPVKKLDLLIDAVAKLRDKEENYNLAIIGDGDERIKLEQLVESYNLSSQVWFYGTCYDEKTNAELLYNADLCVSPGNVGLTAMHSLMFGCPVISNDDFNTQMPEFEAIVPGKTGDFFHAYEAADLAKVISRWFDTKSVHREEIRKNCFKVIDSEWNPKFQMKILIDVLTR